MNTSKIHLSPEELQLVQNAQLLLTKNNIIEKVYALFGELASALQQSSIYTTNYLPAELLTLGPKISRGEKYKGLPYVMLDYPRCFGKEDIFAVRSFFWWGNFFSVTLHLKGKYQQLYIPYLQKQSALLAANDFQVCFTGEEWEHDLSDGNYIPLSIISDTYSEIDLTDKPFYKITSRVELHQWNEMNERLLGLQQVIANAIAG
ncbi:MAG TPA: hypothetical protein VIY47_03485 [Ignavibacteriaceae bacterium]